MPFSLRDALRKNRGLKFLSLILAVLLWYLAAGQERLETGYIVPLELQDLPDHVALEGGSLEFVHVRVRGPRNLVQKLTPQKIRASLSLRDLKAGENFIPITDKDIHLPGDLELVTISPPYLFLKTLARRRVHIKPVVLGTPAEGYRLAQVVVVPNTVNVVGPPGKINAIREIPTLPIAIKGVRESLAARADLVVTDPEVRLMEMVPAEVHVSVEPLPIRRTLPRVPVTVVGADRAVVQPDHVQVILEGPAGLLEQLEQEGVDAVVESSGERRGRRKLRVVVHPPEGVRVVEVNPSVVAVVINP